MEYSVLVLLLGFFAGMSVHVQLGKSNLWLSDKVGSRGFGGRLGFLLVGGMGHLLQLCLVLDEIAFADRWHPCCWL